MRNTKRKFINFSRSDTPDTIKRCFEDYQEYLLSNRDKFPDKAFNFAQADWHYNAEDPRCPHDAWVETLEISEEKIAENNSKRNINIQIKLLGAYHDGIITIFYKNVKFYYLDKFPLHGHNAQKAAKDPHFHGDWLADEIYLSEEGYVIHDIEFVNSVRWLIHCEDIDYSWRPFEEVS